MRTNDALSLERAVPTINVPLVLRADVCCFKIGCQRGASYATLRRIAANQSHLQFFQIVCQRAFLSCQ